MNSKLPDVYEGMLVRQSWVQEKHFCHTPSHEMNHWPSVGRGEFCIPDISHVHLFDNHFQQRPMFTVQGGSCQSYNLKVKKNKNLEVYFPKFVKA